MTLRMLCLLMTLFAQPVVADPLAQMQGNWIGSGWARETVSGPKEVLRCRLKNTYDAHVLTLKGRCVASGRKLTLSGEMKQKSGSDQITGHWFNPDGLGSVRIKGSQTKTGIAFALRAKDPDTGEEIARAVEWRFTSDGLRLRVQDLASPQTVMSDITFSR